MANAGGDGDEEQETARGVRNVGLAGVGIAELAELVLDEVTEGRRDVLERGPGLPVVIAVLARAEREHAHDRR